MTITTTENNSCLALGLRGRLDTTAVPELETVIKNELGGVDRLMLNIEDLTCLSSVGLRVILTAQKQMNRRGTTTVHNMCRIIMRVFEVTEFTDILTIG